MASARRLLLASAAVVGLTLGALAIGTSTAQAATPGSFTVTTGGLDTRTGTAAGARVGDGTQYVFYLTNTSSVLLLITEVSVPALGGDAGCDEPAIAPAGQAGETTVCHINSHTFSQGDFDAGVLHTVATATATTTDGTVVHADPSAFDLTADITHPAIAITESATPSTGAVPGTSVHYGFSVHNTGDVSLSSVSVADPAHPGITCPVDAPLVPGGTASCSGVTHVVTQAEFDAGVPLHDSSSAAAVAVRGAAPALVTGSADVTMGASATAIAVTASAVDDRTGVSSGARAGDTLSYSFTVHNTGNEPLATVVITDSRLAAGVVMCPAVPTGGLPPDATSTCTAASATTVTQADVDAGSASSSFAAAATFTRGPAASATGSADVTVVDPAGAVAITDTASIARTGGTSGAVVGDVVTYSYHVTNTGNVTLTALTVTDRLTGISCPPVPPAGLPPGGGLDCTGSYAVTQTDVDAGTVTDAVTADASFARGGDATTRAGAAVRAADPVNAVALTVTAAIDGVGGTTEAVVGQRVSYVFAVTNTSNIDLTALALTDPTLAGALDCPSLTGAPVPPGATLTCTATAARTFTQGDFDAGRFADAASVTATFARGPSAAAQASAPVTAAAALPALALTAAASVHPHADREAAQADDTITFAFGVTNTGNVTVTEVAVANLAGAVTCAATTLAPGSSTTCRTDFPRTVTAADIAVGRPIVTLATASGLPARGLATVDSAVADAAVQLAAPPAAVSSGGSTPTNPPTATNPAPVLAVTGTDTAGLTGASVLLLFLGCLILAAGGARSKLARTSHASVMWLRRAALRSASPKRDRLSSTAGADGLPFGPAHRERPGTDLTRE